MQPDLGGMGGDGETEALSRGSYSCASHYLPCSTQTYIYADIIHFTYFIVSLYYRADNKICFKNVCFPKWSQDTGLKDSLMSLSCGFLQAF